MIITGGIITVGGGGFVIGVTASRLSDAFLLGLAGAIAVTIVSTFVGGVRWLFTLDRKMTSLVASVEDGFEDAKRERTLLGEELSSVSGRVKTIEAELQPNDGATTRDAINRIDRRSRKVAEQVGAIDYDEGRMGNADG